MMERSTSNQPSPERGRSDVSGAQNADKAVAALHDAANVLEAATQLMPFHYQGRAVEFRRFADAVRECATRMEAWAKRSAS